MEKSVRVRFAPSPTGTLHVGGVRTALFNWLFARHHKGTFLLRIEDTDVERSTEESTRQILDSLQWLQLDWDEEPIFQSHRFALYRAAVDRLRAENKAYKCFCTPEQLELKREKMRAEGRTAIDDTECRERSPEEIDELEQKGNRPAIRLKVEQNRDIVFQDMIYGEIRVRAEAVSDIVIQRSDGTPTYNLAVVIDDHDMAITHVIRGNDHISNTPKQIVIYEALGYDVPSFAHLSLILGTDRTRLSKRHGATSVLEFKNQGFLPEAMVNYLALLGWGPDESTTIMSADEMIERFELHKVSKADAVFDYDKLAWMNGHYMRSLPEQKIIQRAVNFLVEHGIDIAARCPHKVEQAIRLEIPRVKTYSEMLEHLRYFLDDDIAYDDKSVNKHLKQESAVVYLTNIAQTLEKVQDFTHEGLEQAMRTLTEDMNVKFGKLVQPLRVALTGRDASPGIFDVLLVLGKERALQRITYALGHLVNK